MRAVWMGLAAAALATVPAQAQRGLAVEVRGGASAGNYAGAASDFEVAPLPSLSATASYGVTERIGVYAGISHSSFGCDTGFCADREMRFSSGGLDGGVELRLPVAASPWLRAGLVSHSLHFHSGVAQESEARDGQETSGVGFSAAGGVELRLGRRLSVTPGVRYVRYGAAGDDGVALLVGDVGLKIRM
ncbi:MAG TPA: outer membrane beta-barrel protein [Longimicrobium sp.]|nr:outer membrane beta-barrel protein [Longimicrobium sp.]